MKLSVMIDLPEKSGKMCMTPCEKAQKLIDAIAAAPEGGASTEWEVLKETYKRLQQLPKLEGEMLELFHLIHPTLDTFITKDTKDGDIMRSSDYMKWLDAHADLDDKGDGK